MTLVSNGLNNNTKPYTWTFADATARTSATGFVSADVGSWAVQLSDGTVWELTATTPTWAQRGGSGGGGAPTTSKYVLGATDASLTNGITIPGLAGSADRAGQGGSTFAEEFDTTTNPFTWTPSNPTTQNSNTTVPSAFYASVSDTTERYGYRAFSPAGAFDLRAKVSLGLLGGSATPVAQIGLVVADATNANRAFVQITVGVNSLATSGFTYAASTFTQRGSNNVGTYVLYLRLTRDGSNNISFYFSLDGLIWNWIATQAFTLTITQAGLRLSASGTSPSYEAAVDWLRAS